MYTNYNHLLDLISNITSKENSKLIKNNIKNLSAEFSKLTQYITKYINIVSMDKLTKSKRINKIREVGYLNKKFTKKQATEIFKTINFENIIGGGTQEKNLDKLKSELVNNNEPFEFCLKNLPKLLLKLFLTPKYLFLAISSLFYWMTSYFDLSDVGWVDFSQDIDWVYLLLFITASIPYFGMYSDFIIIIKALIDGRYFLAILTILTCINSIILSLHIVDLGVIFKIFYYFDVIAYNKELGNCKKKNESFEYSNNLYQKITFGEANKLKK
jgi:hypothetical protein